MAENQSGSLEKVANGNVEFTNKLYQQLSKNGDNVFFSPISVHTLLSLAHQGTSGNTAKDFTTVLNVDKKTSADGYNGIMKTLNNVENVTLHMANKVYLMDKYKLKENFKTVATEKFLIETELINFAENVKSANSINGWCAEKTNNKISHLVNPSDLNPLTRMVLLNAIYFKGNWLHQFNSAETKVQPFHVTDEESIDVNMMKLKKKFKYAENKNLESQILEMKYTNSEVSMVIVLPNDKNGINALEQKLSQINLSEITKDTYQPEVIVRLPKFKIETEMDLKPVLTEMGLGSMFEMNADFSEMLESPEDLYVDKIVQKAFIEVNEEGAEAAAVTGMMMMARCAIINEPKQFTADHPFFFILKHRSKDSEQDNILFVGKIMRPTKA